MSNEFGSYPDIHPIGSRNLRHLFDGNVLIQEKVDGSQFRFMREADGKLRVRSKSQEFDIDNANGMFAAACKTVKEAGPNLPANWIFSGEVLSKPKHNVLAYDRCPKGNIALFDVRDETGTYYEPSGIAQWANTIGCEAVSYYHACALASSELSSLNQYLENLSFLGGQKVEGIVIKNGDRSLVGKLVSAAFKETAQRPAKKVKDNIIDTVVAIYNLPTRFDKALIHLKEKGVIKGDRTDIGKIVSEVGTDIEKECEQEIKDLLYEDQWPMIRKDIVKNVAGWYMKKLESEVVTESNEPQVTQ